MNSDLKVLSADYMHFCRKRTEAQNEENQVMWSVYDAAMHSVMNQFKNQTEATSDQDALDQMHEILATEKE